MAMRADHIEDNAPDDPAAATKGSASKPQKVTAPLRRGARAKPRGQ